MNKIPLPPEPPKDREIPGMNLPKWVAYALPIVILALFVTTILLKTKVI